MLYAMDNWYYNAKSSARYQVLAHDALIPVGAKEIYRNHLWKLVKGETEFRGQWGISHDDFGRLFYNGNSSPLRGDYFLPNALKKNPGFWPKVDAQMIGSRRVYPARINPGVNRAYLKRTLIDKGKDRGKLKQFTAASGSVVYRGDNFPEQFYGMGITPEPAGNLISARKIIEYQGHMGGEAIFEESELLASTDERFRPVYLYTAPDGSLYIVDMYHGIIQHKEYLTSYLGKQIKDRELDKNNNTMGRIYRLRWQNKPLGKQPRLSGLSANELVPFLAHKNGWWRDTARRLIVQSQSKSVTADIKTLITGNPELGTNAIVNALWTLYGLDSIDYGTLDHVFTHGDEKSKGAAINVSVKLPKNDHEALAKQLKVFAESDYFIAIQVALAAGEIRSPIALDASKTVLDHHIDAPHIREAVLSGLGSRTDEFLERHKNYTDSAFAYYVSNLGRKAENRNNRDQLSSEGAKLYNLGETLYHGKGACAACHGADGSGITDMGPTFWGSEWVATKERLAKVLLHGLQGSIWVNKKQWKTGMVMPGYGNNPELSNEDLAAISTYIRNTWENKYDTGGQVQPELFKQLREQTKNRALPYSQSDF